MASIQREPDRLHKSESKETEVIEDSRTLPQPVPITGLDGSFTAWVQCAGAFLLFFNSWGIVNTFGVYQTFYEEDLLHTRSSSDISWIGSVQASLLMLGSLIAGPLYDAGYLKSLVITGSFLVVFGMMMTSLCTSFWQTMLAQGLVIGIGNGCLFVPSITLLPTYFTTKRALAMGIAASGSSIGGVLYPIVFHKLQPEIGFGWSTRIIAFIMLVTLMVPVLSMKMRIKPLAVRPWLDQSAWMETPFVYFGCAMFLGFLGLYIPFFYIQLQSIQQEGLNKDLVFYLLPLLNGGSFFGRLIPNYFADKVGPLNTMAACSLVTTIIAFCWIRVHSAVGAVFFCILYGFFSGTFVSLSGPVVATALCPHMGMLGVRTGMLSVPMAIGLLIGNPIAGAISRGGWTGLQSFCGVAVGFSTICLIGTRVMKVGRNIGVKC